MSNTSSPGPAVVAEYGLAALDNARALIAEAELLTEHRYWARACSLGILATEEAAKAYLCGLMPVLPPEQAEELFAWPFVEANRHHDLKLAIAAVIMQILQAMQATDASLPQAPGWDVLISESNANNDLKQRGFYVGFRDGKILRPADLTEAEARKLAEQASGLANLAEHFIASMANLPEEVLEVREAIWQTMVEEFERGGYEGLVAYASDVGASGLDADDRAAIHAAVLAVASGAGLPEQEPPTETDAKAS